MRERAQKITAKKKKLEERLLDPLKLSREDLLQTQKDLAELSVLAKCSELYLHTLQEREDAEKELVSAESGEWKEYLKAEILDLSEKLHVVQKDLSVALLPKDIMDSRNVILEVRAGTGGDEAALFAADLMRMYMRYAAKRNWRVEVMSVSETGTNGVKEAIMLVSGNNVFARLKFESGGHRVQRVPETESQGRVHTSAATVAVLPEVEDVDVVLDPNDLRIDVFRSSGPGGQSVNTTDSAVRITHIPSGLVVQQQDEKSQHKNKEKALKILRSRLYELEKSKQMEERSNDRKQQLGSGDRSERIRTYNFPQDRFVDHRINKRFSDLRGILDGEKLDDIIRDLLEHDRAEKLSQTTEELDGS